MRRESISCVARRNRLRWRGSASARDLRPLKRRGVWHDEMCELRKREWCLLNPNATPAQYTAAMRQIASEIGV